MKIKFLGTGGGLCSTKVNYHSNAIIEHNGKKLLIDCGSNCPSALEEAGIDINDIDAIYISHLHADHCGGMEFVGFKRYFSKFPFGSNKPKLFGNVRVIKDLWSKTLRGGMETVQNKKNTLKSYFDVNSISPNGKFTWEDITFNLIQTVHVVDNREIKPSYGLMIQSEGKNIFFTADTQFAPNQIMAYYEQADVIFHDCELANYPQSVHAQYHQLASLPEKYKRKMWLYHYDGDTSKFNVKEDLFLGFVQKGWEFLFEERI